ncbi:MAG: hypothetical protein HY900_13450 [Deltaproteobacteria bacterium]|nr:hypothetical protein [Deltaproteobacteria bacterium]
MARKKDKRGKRKPAGASHEALPLAALDAEVARLEARGDYSAMLEAAKALYKRRPDAVSGARIAEAYWGRILQLREKGLYREATALLPLRDRYRPGERSPGERSVEERRTRFHLLLHAGQVEAAAKELHGWPGTAEDADLLRADLLILYPQAAHLCGADSEGRLAAGLQAVQHALAAYDREDDGAAFEALKTLGLKSPFRQWRLFLRGAIAFHRCDDEAAGQALSAIPAETAAGELAGAFLRALAGGASDPLATQPIRAESASLESRRDALLRAGGSRDFGALLSSAQTLVGAAPSEPRIQRLVALFLWHCLLQHRGKDPSRQWPAVKSFFRGRIVDDSHFSRTKALTLEQMGGWEEAEECWMNFAEGVEAGRVRLPPGATPEQARARVHLQAARDLVKAQAEARGNPFAFEEPRHSKVEDHLERAIELDPARPDPCLAGLAVARDEWGDLKRAGHWADRLAECFPEHLEGLLLAADVALRRRVFRKALGFLRRAEAVEPLHPEVRRLKGEALLLSARKRTAERKHDLARKDYQAALPFQEARRVPAVRLELGCLELVAGCRAEGEALVGEAVAGLGAGAGVWFRATIEGQIQGVDPKLRGEWSARLDELLAQPERGAALELAAVYREYERDARAGRTLDRTRLTRYLAKCTHLVYTSEEALNLCHLLHDLEATSALGALARRSRETHPGDFHFPTFEILARPNLLPGDIESLEDCREKALAAGDERFARLIGGVLAAHEPWDDDDGWGDEGEGDELGLPGGMPRELLDAMRELLEGALGPPAPPRGRRAKRPRRQLGLFGDDE